jgi:hypothetical protein
LPYPPGGERIFSHVNSIEDEFFTTTGLSALLQHARMHVSPKRCCYSAEMAINSISINVLNKFSMKIESTDVREGEDARSRRNLFKV